MAEGGRINLKGSRSVEDMMTKKPGKLSADLLNKFESDPALSRPESYPSVNMGSHLSAEDILCRSASVDTKVKGNVRISFSPGEEIPGPSVNSSTEEILDCETAEDSMHSKKRSRWKWHPFKKMKKLFSRKKHPNRTKSFGDVKATGYTKSSTGFRFEDEDNSLGTRTKSEPSLPGSAPGFSQQGLHSTDRIVQRTRSVPPRQNVLMQELKRRQLGSHEEVHEGLAISPEDKETKTVSLPALNWSLVSSNSGAEAAVGFDSVPSASSLEGLQAAHDKIKAAPKHRRPPGRARSRTSSAGKTVKEPPQKRPPQKRPNIRSNTVPEDLIGKKEETETTISEASRHSGIVSRTIFESTEIGEDGVSVESLSPVSQEPKTSDEKAAADEALAQIGARASELLAQTEGRPIKLSERKINSAKSIAVEGRPRDIGEGRIEDSAGSRMDEKEEVITNESQVKEGEEPGRETVKLDSGSEQQKNKNNRRGKENDEEQNSANDTTVKTEVNTAVETKLNSSETTKPTVNTADKPDWIMLAQKKTKRMSQMLETPDTNGEDEDCNGKNETPVQKTTSISGKMKKIEKPKILPFKPVIVQKSPEPATTTAEAKTNLQRTPLITRSLSESKPKNMDNRSAGTQCSFRGFQCDKCIVCGTKVYQTERCSFDNSVLHRHCIKCTVCNRLLTIGNFVVSESKIYCKPHVGQVVPVSM